MYKSTLIIIFSILSIFLLNINANESDLVDKINRLIELNKKNSIIRLGFNDYKKLVKSSPRNYSLILMLTALDASRECEQCANAYPEFETLSKSWLYSQEYASNKLYFTLIDVDYDGGMEVFRSLNLNHAPVIMHIPAKGKPKAKDTYEANKRGFEAPAIAKWVQERTNIDIKITKPLDTTKIGLAVAIIVIFLTIFIFYRKHLLQIAFNRTLWSILVIGFILIFLSGHMWNTIRSPPFARNSAKGKSYVAPSNSYQYIAETYIVIAIYTAIIFGFVFINESVKFSRTSLKLLGMIFGIGVISIFFGVLLFIFEKKFQGYPYGLTQVMNVNYEL